MTGFRAKIIACVLFGMALMLGSCGEEGTGKGNALKERGNRVKEKDSATGESEKSEANGGKVQKKDGSKSTGNTKESDERKHVVLDLGKETTMKLVYIEPGKFLMGSKMSREEVTERFGEEVTYFVSEHPQHRVHITRGFYMGVTEVTQQQYEAVMGETTTCFDGKKNPVEMVSWKDARRFCRKLRRKTGKNVRLPTEAEWEYACRAGSTTLYHFGDDPTQLEQYAWYKANSGGKTHPVGEKKPNAWGLYDMHGNVWEWCRNRYGPKFYEKSRFKDPTGPNRWHSSTRVLRGGSWNFSAYLARAATRLDDEPNLGSIMYGFRVIMRPE